MTRKTLPTLAEQIAECAAEMDRKKHLQRKSFLRRSLQRLQSQNTCFFWWCPIDRSISGHSLALFQKPKPMP